MWNLAVKAGNAANWCMCLQAAPVSGRIKKNTVVSSKIVVRLTLEYLNLQIKVFYFVKENFINSRYREEWNYKKLKKKMLWWNIIIKCEQKEIFLNLSIYFLSLYGSITSIRLNFENEILSIDRFYVTKLRASAVLFLHTVSTFIHLCLYTAFYVFSCAGCPCCTYFVPALT